MESLYPANGLYFGMVEVGPVSAVAALEMRWVFLARVRDEPL